MNIGKTKEVSFFQVLNCDGGEELSTSQLDNLLSMIRNAEKSNYF